MQRRHGSVCRGGDDRARAELPLVVTPDRPQAREGERLASRARDVEGALGTCSALPLVEAVSQDQTAKPAERVAKRPAVLERLGARVDHLQRRLGRGGPARDQAPTQLLAPRRSVPVGGYRQDLVTGGDVEPAADLHRLADREAGPELGWVRRRQRVATAHGLEAAPTGPPPAGTVLRGPVSGAGAPRGRGPRRRRGRGGSRRR